ncbi:MAG: hypothetical protein ACI9SJ_002365 [Flavobacteriaceae bacterium]|jgi:hypothetical protein|uniref:ribonuclease Z n=1 Tax=Candidatus Marifrigoribacter sp. Uisw_064 TaxID=3230970 RepID=UPI003AED5175
MKISEQENYVILEDDRNDIKDFSSYLEYIIPKKNKGQNVIVDLLKYEDLTLNQLLLFMDVSNTHMSENQSFVIVNNAISPDELPDELSVVPTLIEAEDLIEMENIERELGF